MHGYTQQPGYVQQYPQPEYGQPIYGPPAYGPPAYGPPMYGQSPYGPPVYGQPYGPGYGPGYQQQQGSEIGEKRRLGLKGKVNTLEVVMGMPDRDGMLPNDTIHVFVPRLSFQTDTQGRTQADVQQGPSGGSGVKRDSVKCMQYHTNYTQGPNSGSDYQGHFGNMYTSYNKATFIPPPAEPEPDCIECWATLLAHSNCLAKIINCFRCCGCQKVAGKLQEYNVIVDCKDKLEEEKRKRISKQNKSLSSHIDYNRDLKRSEQQNINDVYTKIFQRLDTDVKEKLLAHLVHSHPDALKSELERGRAGSHADIVAARRASAVDDAVKEGETVIEKESPVVKDEVAKRKSLEDITKEVTETNRIIIKEESSGVDGVLEDDQKDLNKHDEVDTSKASSDDEGRKTNETIVKEEVNSTSSGNERDDTTEIIEKDDEKGASRADSEDEGSGNDGKVKKEQA